VRLVKLLVQGLVCCDSHWQSLNSSWWPVK
jgi:hypothetical protein